MRVLVPLDGSECSFDALRFATEFVTNFDASLHVVHFVESDAQKDDQETQDLLAKANDILTSSGIADEPTIETDAWITPYTYAGRVGKDILNLVHEDNYDHVIMGHHGAGVVTRTLLGSTAETVVEDATVPVTIVPE